MPAEATVPCIVIADGFLWQRDTSASPMLDGCGAPIEENIAKVRGKSAQVLTYVAKNRQTILMVQAWLREHLPDAEIWGGYGFPYGRVYGDLAGGDVTPATKEEIDAAYAAGYAAAEEALTAPVPTAAEVKAAKAEAKAEAKAAKDAKE